jgi:glyoxylase-like metal-dependent hydrolase (beta-lactamase superfamily II)
LQNRKTLTYDARRFRFIPIHITNRKFERTAVWFAGVRMRIRQGIIRLLGGLLCLCWLLATAQAQAEKTASDILDQAIQAIGGAEKLKNLKTIYVESVNTRQEIGQSYLPSLSEDFARLPRETFITETWVDFAQGKRYWLRKLDGTKYTNITTPTWGANLGGDRMNHLGAAVVDLYQHRNRHQTFPGPLFTALEKRQELRRLPDQRWQDQAHAVIAFSDMNREIRLYVNQVTGLLAKVESDVTALVRGKVTLEYRYGKWKEFNGLKLPLRTEGVNTQNAASHWLIEDQLVVVNQPEGNWFTEHEKEMKDGLARVARDRETMAAAPAPLKADKLGEGIFLLRGNINSLAVAMGDYAFVVEAPTSEARSKQVIAQVKELIPNKQLAAIGVTHWHYDTIAGLRAYIAEGARVAASASYKDLLEKLASAANHDDALSKSKNKLQFLSIDNERSFTLGPRTITAIEIPNQHAAGMLGLYVKEEKLFFVGEAVPPGSAFTRAVLEALQKHKLEVKTLVSARTGVVALDQLTAVTTNK